MPLVTGKIEPEAVFKAGLAEIEGRATSYGREKHRVFTHQEESSDDSEIKPKRESSQERAVSDIVSCELGCLHGLKIGNKRGDTGAEVVAELCACTDGLNGELRGQLEARANSIRRSDIPPLFANRSEEFIDMRYTTGLPTIYISNHTFSKKTSYDGITIQMVLGKRIADRMRATRYHEFNDPSRRGMKRPDDYTEEEIRSYSLPSSVLKQRDDELQVLNWITRNPIFEPVDRRERKIAVDENGSKIFLHDMPVDADREHAKVCHNVWQKDDKLVLRGLFYVKWMRRLISPALTCSKNSINMVV